MLSFKQSKVKMCNLWAGSRRIQRRQTGTPHRQSCLLELEIRHWWVSDLIYLSKPLKSKTMMVPRQKFPNAWFACEKWASPVQSYLSVACMNSACNAYRLSSPLRSGWTKSSIIFNAQNARKKKLMDSNNQDPARTYWCRRYDCSVLKKMRRSHAFSKVTSRRIW